MPRRGVCDSSAGAWCRPKCHGRLWEHRPPLCCLLPEYITHSKAAFLRRQYRSQEQGMEKERKNKKMIVMYGLDCISKDLKGFFYCQFIPQPNVSTYDAPDS